MQHPEFRTAYRNARRELVESSMGRLQVAASQAVETLLVVCRQGRRDGDRVRAAIVILEHALRGLAEAELLRGEEDLGDLSPMATDDVVGVLGRRLRKLDRSELPTAEKSRLTASLADALLRAIGVSVLDTRLEALQAVLLARKDKE